MKRRCTGESLGDIESARSNGKLFVFNYSGGRIVGKMYRWRGLVVHTIFLLTQPLYLAARYLLNPEYFSLVHTYWFALTAITWIYIVTRISIPFFTSPFHNVPSPPGERFLLGHLDLNGGRPPTDNIVRLLENTPNDGLLVLWLPFYLSCQIIPTRPDTLMDMLNTHSYDWEKPAEVRRLLAKITGEGLIGVEGDQHKSMRRVVAPAFSGRHIRDLVPLFYAKGLAFADSLAREATNSTDATLEMMAQMSRVTLDIIGAAGVGKDFNTVENNENPLAILYATMTNEGSIPMSLFINLIFPRWTIKYLKGTIYAKIEEAQTQLRKGVRALIQEKKQVMLDKPEQQKDIIAIIMASGDFSDDYLVDQLLTFLAAGHDTTASTLTWTLWLLALNPRIQDLLRAECNTHLTNTPLGEINASIFDPETTPYLSAVCNETLRLYPSVPATSRRAIRPTTIGTQPIPQGTSGLIAPWAINRSVALWGADANAFVPERWLAAAAAGDNGSGSGSGSVNPNPQAQVNPHPYAFLTFLHGPRACIGQSFARTEIRCLLAALVVRFRFELPRTALRDKVEVGGFFTIKPHNGLRLRLCDLRAAG